MTEGRITTLPVVLPDGTLLGRALVNPSNGWLKLVEVEPLLAGFTVTDSPSARMAEIELARLQERVAELEAQLNRTIRERDRWAAKYGRLQAAALELKVEASDSEEELGADAWDPETRDFRQERPGG